MGAVHLSLNFRPPALLPLQSLQPPLLLLLQRRRWPNFKSWERFSFGVVLLPPRQQQQIRRPQDR